MRVNVGLLIVRGLAASVVLALLLAANSAAAPASGASLAPALQKDVRALVAEGVPGVVVLVRREGRTVQLAGGYSNLEKKTPMRVGDRSGSGASRSRSSPPSSSSWSARGSSRSTTASRNGSPAWFQTATTSRFASCSAIKAASSTI